MKDQYRMLPPLFEGEDAEDGQKTINLMEG